MHFCGEKESSHQCLSQLMSMHLLPPPLTPVYDCLPSGALRIIIRRLRLRGPARAPTSELRHHCPELTSDSPSLHQSSPSPWPKQPETPCPDVSNLRGTATAVQPFGRRTGSNLNPGPGGSSPGADGPALSDPTPAVPGSEARPDLRGTATADPYYWRISGSPPVIAFNEAQSAPLLTEVTLPVFGARPPPSSLLGAAPDPGRVPHLEQTARPSPTRRSPTNRRPVALCPVVRVC